MDSLPKIVLFRWRGVPVFVDVTFVIVPLVLFPWRLIPELAFGDTGEVYVTRRLAMWAIMVGGTFASILLHEMAHVLAARCFHVVAHSVQVGGFFGLALLPVTPLLKRAIVPILAAGPLGNLAIALALWLAMGMPEVSGRLYVTFPREAGDGGSVYPTSVAMSGMVWLFQLNVAMAIYNLLPAFPLDGGRMARIGLRRAVGEARSVSVVAACGFVVGVWSILGGIGLGATLITIGLMLTVYNVAIWRREVEAPED